MISRYLLALAWIAAGGLALYGTQHGPLTFRIMAGAIGAPALALGLYLFKITITERRK